MPKVKLGLNVYQAAIERIKWTFDNFDKIYLSFSGGKDSTVMLHLVMDEAIKRNKKIGVLFIDLEGKTIELNPNQGTTISKGVMHRPRAPKKTVMLMVETVRLIPLVPKANKYWPKWKNSIN